jgi:hypothetical protein
MTRNSKFSESRIVIPLTILVVLLLILLLILFWPTTRSARADDNAKPIGPLFACARFEDAKVFIETYISASLKITPEVSRLMTSDTCGQYTLWPISSVYVVARYPDVPYGENGRANVIVRRILVSKVSSITNGDKLSVTETKTYVYYFRIEIAKPPRPKKQDGEETG